MSIQIINEGNNTDVLIVEAPIGGVYIPIPFFLNGQNSSANVVEQSLDALSNGFTIFGLQKKALIALEEFSTSKTESEFSKTKIKVKSKIKTEDKPSIILRKGSLDINLTITTNKTNFRLPLLDSYLTLSGQNRQLIRYTLLTTGMIGIRMFLQSFSTDLSNNIVRVNMSFHNPEQTTKKAESSAEFIEKKVF